MSDRATPASLRREQILRRVQSQGAVTIAELARIHSISNMTAHRDLEQLAREGLVKRIRGGARALGRAASHGIHPTAWEHRIRQAPEAKLAIADHAARLVSPGSTIFLDASSTALAVAVALMRDPPHGLTLVTNSPMIAGQIHADAIHVVICPGELDQQMRTVGGRWTVDFVRRLNFDAAFISCAGLTLEAGLTTSRGTIADVLSTARSTAASTIGLIDSSKFGSASLVTIAAAQDLDLIITDRRLPDRVARDFRDAGVRLKIAGDIQSDG